MDIIEKDSYILFQFSDIKDWNDFQSSEDAIEKSKGYNQNVIFSFDTGISFNSELLEELGNFSVALGSINKSFVVVTDFAKEDIDHVLNLIPTEHEAMEFIFMEEIERSL